jgi:hypothetical protein
MRSDHGLEPTTLGSCLTFSQPVAERVPPDLNLKAFFIDLPQIIESKVIREFFDRFEASRRGSSGQIIEE